MRLFVRVLRKLEFRIFRSFTVVLLLLLNLKLQGQLKLCLYITHNYQGVRGFFRFPHTSV